MTLLLCLKLLGLAVVWFLLTALTALATTFIPRPGSYVVCAAIGLTCGWVIGWMIAG